MISGYTSTGGILRKKSLLVAVGMVALPLSLHLHKADVSAPSLPMTPRLPQDPRVARLHTFLTQLDCPVAALSEDFVRVADLNHLDWRLLPSIAVIESGGGKAYKNNNVFGWNGGEQYFSSLRAGLDHVAFKLGRSPLYRRHDSVGKLRIYNENEDYADSVLAVMNRISPLRPVAMRATRVPAELSEVPATL